MEDSDLDTLLAKLAATPKNRAPVERFSGTHRFEIRRRLGGGAFGDVYEARNREHGNLVALKALKSNEPDWIYRFKREFRVVGDLAHPNVVRLYELFCEEDRWYLTMELVNGLPFDRYVEQSPGELRAVFGQLATGLEELHQHGCLHRDIKPSNVLVERSGRVVLLDFGLTVDTRTTKHTTVAGTPPFMAPELAMGGPPTQASDWYAYGVMLYRALAGDMPFDGTPSQVFSAKLAGEPPPPRDLRPDADPALADLAMRLLSPVSSERPTGSEVLAIVSDGSADATDDEVASMFVGRREELRRMVDALASVRHGVSRLIKVSGEPGIGKSTLLRAFAASVPSDVQLYQGRCHETELVPYKGLDGAMDMLCEDLARRPYEEVEALGLGDLSALTQMFPMLKRVPALARSYGRQSRTRSLHGTRRSASQAFRGLLARLTAKAPVVLMIDDLQWAGDDGVRLLLQLLAAPTPPLLCVVAYRRSSVGHSASLDRFLDEVEPRIVSQEISLDALDADGIAELVANQQGTNIDASQAMRETGGHPYLLSRLFEGQESRGVAADDLRGLLTAQIMALPQVARDVLEVVSLAAVPLTTRSAFQAIGAPLDPAVVDQLRRDRLVQRPSGGDDAPIEAYHDRVREMTVAAIDDARRAELHGRLAEFFETHGRSTPDALAHHYREAGNRAKALEWTLEAAREATSSLAFERAAQLFADAVALADDPVRRLALMHDLAEAHVRTGRRTDAATTCVAGADLARQLSDVASQAALRARAGEHFLLAGHLDRGRQLIAEALEAIDVRMPNTPGEAVAMSFNAGGELATRGLAFVERAESEVPPDLLRRVDLELEIARALQMTDVRAPWIASLAALDALEAGEPCRVQRAMALYAVNNSPRYPDHPLVVQALATAHALAGRLGDDLALAWAAYAEAFCCLYRDQFRAAIGAFRTALRRFSVLGPTHAREASMVRISMAMLLGNFGIDLHLARRLHEPEIADALERGDLFAANWARMTACWLAISAGDIELGRAHVKATRETWPTIEDSLFATTLVLNEMMLAVYVDDVHAWDTIERLMPEFRSLYSSWLALPRAVIARLAGNAVMAAYRAGVIDRDTAKARIEPMFADVKDLVYATSNRLILSSHLCALDGDDAGSREWLVKARDLWSHHEQPVLFHCVELRLAQLDGDAEAEARAFEALVEAGVVEPERFAAAFPGPRPTRRAE